VNRYAVLFKGINVGGKKKIPMADLRDLLGQMGFTEVSTYLQSGNAVVASPDSAQKVATRIEKALHETFGMNVRCLVRTGPELQAVIDAHPLAEVAQNGSWMFALFLSADPDPTLVKAHDVRELAPGNVAVGDQVIYQWCPQGPLESPNVAAFAEKHWKLTVTGRNWNTVSKLADLLS
jgi:uncharacterized protein (DUF1697 family)